MNTIKASSVLSDLSVIQSPSIKLMVDEIVKAQNNYALGQQLTIEICTDDDFTVNGQRDFIQHYPLVSDVLDTYESAIKTLNFGSSFPNNKYIEPFIEMINSTVLKDELATTGSVSMGGNRTIDVSLSIAPKFIMLGNLKIMVNE